MEDINKFGINQSQSQSSSFQKNKLVNNSQKEDSDYNEFRLKMQNMHDYLKDQMKIGKQLNGDYGNDPPSIKSLDDQGFVNHFGQNENQSINKFQYKKQFTASQSSNSHSCFDETSFKKEIFQQKQDDSEKQEVDHNLKQDFTYFSAQNMNSCDLNANSPINSPRSERLHQSLQKFHESSEDSSKYKTNQQIEMNHFSMVSKNELVKKDENDHQQKKKLNVNSTFFSSIKKQNYIQQKSKNKQGLISRLICCYKPKKNFKSYNRSLTFFENNQQCWMQKQNTVKSKIHKFTTAILQRKLKKNLNDIEPNNLKLIDDLSYQFQNKNNVSTLKKSQSSNSVFRNIMVKVQNFQSIIIDNFKEEVTSIKVFMPTSSAIVIWDLLQIFMTYLFLFLYSIQVFFAQNERKSQQMITFFEVMLALTLVDILKKFNTSYFEKDQIIQIRSKIIFQYITSSIFITDLVSLSTIIFKLKYRNEEVCYNPDNSLILYFENFLIFFLLNRTLKQKQILRSIITIEHNHKYFFWLFQQILNVVLVAHIISIGFYMLGVYEDQNGFEISWLQKYQITDLHYLNRYIYSIYWAVTTMTTVGYGDIAATNPSEALFISIAMIVFSCVYAYSINNIGLILQEVEKSSKKLNENIFIIQRYLNRKSVDIQLKTRVRFYLSFLEQESKNRDKQAEDRIIGTLSNQLREEITQQINSKILENQNIFINNFSHKINKSIVFIMEEVLVSPNEIIFQENDINDQSIYFIQSGFVEIFSNCFGQDKDSSRKIYQTITQNQFFGEISFFSGLARSASARSVNLTTLYRIKRDKFIDLLKTSESDFERFKMIQEQITIHGNLNSLFLKCYSCKKKGHLATNCPQTHAYFDKQFIFLKSNFTETQSRQQDHQRAEKTQQFNPIIQAKKNILICKKLKQNCRNLNSRTQFFYDITSEEDEEEETTFNQESLQTSDEEDDQSNRFGLEIKNFVKQMTDLSHKIESRQTQRLTKSNQEDESIAISENAIGQNKLIPVSNDQISINLYLNNNNYEQQQVQSNLNVLPDTQQFSKVEQIVSVLKKIKQMPKNNRNNENSKENNTYQQPNLKQQQFTKSRSDIKNAQNPKQVNFNIQNPQSQIQDQKSMIFYQQKISKDLIDDQDISYLSPQIEKTTSQSNNQQQYSLSATCFKAFEQQIPQLEKSDEKISKEQLRSIKSHDLQGNLASSKINQSKQFNLQLKSTQNPLNQEYMSDKIKSSQKVFSNLIKSNNDCSMMYNNNRLPSEQEFFYQVELHGFDRVKIFKKFFPQNNIDKVISALKKINIQQRKERTKKNLGRRRQIVFAFDHIQNRLICETPIGSIRQKQREKTSLSYGVNLKQKDQLNHVN